MAVTTDFGDHHVDLAVVVEDALSLGEDDLGLEGANPRTSVLEALREQAASLAAWDQIDGISSHCMHRPMPRRWPVWRIGLRRESMEASRSSIPPCQSMSEMVEFRCRWA